MVSDYKHLIQRIRYDDPKYDGSRYGYRTCYYTLDEHGDDIKFGQFAQQLTQREYRTLLAKARRKQWPVF